MSQYDDLIQVVIKQKPIMMKCLDKRDCNSKRVSFYNARRKLPAVVQDTVGISMEKYNEEWYVNIFIKTEPEVFVKGEHGLERLSIDSPDVKRLKETMKADGITDEEIAQYFIDQETSNFDIQTGGGDEGAEK